MYEHITEMINVLQYICKHMMEPLSYLPWGLFAGLVFLVLEGLWRNIARHKGVSRTAKRRCFICLCVIYTTVLLNLTYFSREPGSRIGLTIELFRTWGNSPVEHAYFIENIILFIPFGILFPFVFSPFRRPAFCVWAGFVFSVFLEWIQLVTGRGYCQLDDVLTNTLGSFIGWGCYRFWDWRRKRPHGP